MVAEDAETETWATRTDVGGYVETRYKIAPPRVPSTPEERLLAAATALAALDGITAPVLPVDVLDILTDVRTALEG